MSRNHVLKHLAKKATYSARDYCKQRRDVCEYCRDKNPCIFYKRIIFFKNNRVHIYKITR